MERRIDPLEAKARELCVNAGQDPDGRIPMPGKERTMPAWCSFRDAARAHNSKEEAEVLASQIVNARPQEEQYQNSPLKVFGEHEETTISQMRNCMSVGNVVGGVVCADGHLRKSYGLS